MSGHKIKGKYMVYKVFRHSARRQILRINLSREDAQRVVKQYKDSSRSMVVFTQQ